MLLLLLAALSIDPRITYPWSLSVIVNIPGHVQAHTEHYRSLDQCQAEEEALMQSYGLIPEVVVVPCNYVGLV